jgi:hypothetical protein
MAQFLRGLMAGVALGYRARGAGKRRDMAQLLRVLVAGAALGYLLARRTDLVSVLRGRSSKAPLESLSKDELYQRAREAEIAGRSRMSKDELVSAIVERREDVSAGANSAGSAS